MRLSLDLGLGSVATMGTGVGAPVYRFSASGCKPPGAFVAGNRQFNSRSVHRAARELVDPVILLPNYFSNSSVGDQGGGTTLEFRAAIEWGGVNYPAVDPVTGDPFVIAANKSVASMIVPGLQVPDGDSFFVRVYGKGPSGVPYFGAALSGNRAWAAGGDRLEIGGLGVTLTDRSTGTGVFTASNAVNMYRPVGILTKTTGSGVLIIGDSNDEGAREEASSPDLGIMARAIGSFMGYANCGVGSESYLNFVSKDYSIRVALAQYATHLGLGLGTNDVAAALATIQARHAALLALFPGLIPVHRMIPPRTTSTDGWATSGNQTVVSTETRKNEVNDWYRTMRFIETNGLALEVNAAGVLTVNGGRWAGSGWTISDGGEGVHVYGSAPHEAIAAQSASFMSAFAPY